MRWRRRAEPLLSVVVPVYQVEQYLAAALESVLGQDHRALEVIVVDDGSTDGSAAIAASVAARDERVRVLRQDNAGLGAARNTGIAAATGELLTFADSDDVVLPGAYRRMVGALERSGSPLVVGGVDRFAGDPVTGERWRTPLMAENHRADHLATSVEERPLLLADVFAWNKVVRRSFWDSHGLAFPVGVRYEDQPTLTEALVAAPSIDVLAASVYAWRQREDGTSISQQRATLADLADRFATKRTSTATVEQHCSPGVREVWYRRVLPVDLWEYLRAVPLTGEDFWAGLRDGVRSLWHEATVPVWEVDLPPRQRLMLWLVDADRREDLVALLGWLDRHDGVLPRIGLGGREVADHPFRDDPALPASLRGL